MSLWGGITTMCTAFWSEILLLYLDHARTHAHTHYVISQKCRVWESKYQHNGYCLWFLRSDGEELDQIKENSFTTNKNCQEWCSGSFVRLRSWVRNEVSFCRGKRWEAKGWHCGQKSETFSWNSCPSSLLILSSSFIWEEEARQRRGGQTCYITSEPTHM